MFQLSLPVFILARLAAHAEETFPEECCGVLIGERAPSGRAAAVARAITAANVARERRRRYAIDPAVLLEAHKEVRQTEEQIVGYYHSHPDRPAVPSAFDLEHAWPGASYVIVALHAGRLAEVRSYRLVEGAFTEEMLIKEIPVETRSAT